MPLKLVWDVCAVKSAVKVVHMMWLEDVSEDKMEKKENGE